MYTNMSIRFLTLSLVGLLTVFASCTNDMEVKQDDAPKNMIFDEVTTAEGHIRVKIDSNLEEQSDFSTEKLARLLGAEHVERTFPYGGKFEYRMRKSGLHLWYEVYFDTKLPTRSITASEVSGIQLVEPSYVVTRVDNPQIVESSSVATKKHYRALSSGFSLPFNDPLISKQWHYHNDGSLGAEFTAGADINLFPAWELETGKPEVIVAIFDGGVEYTHPDLAANIWINTAEKQGNIGVDNDNNGYIGDVHGWNFYDDSNIITFSNHATHVAGIVAAVNNNGIGVAGVAGGNGSPNSGVRLMSCQIASSEGIYGTDEKIKRAYVYAANNGAVIAQCSWGYRYGIPLPQSDREAIDYFIDNAGTDENGAVTGPMKGGLAVFAAGNSGSKIPVYPAAMDRVLAVTSMRQDYKIPSISNYGTYIDIVAPGGDQSAQDAPWIWSTGADGKYVSMLGTSMACPHVSGAAALVISKYGVGHPGLTNEKVMDILKKSANDEIYTYNPSYIFFGEKRLGSGFLDVYGALLNAADPVAVSKIMTKWGATSVQLSWTVPANEYGQTPSKYIIVHSTSSLDGIDPANIPQGIAQVSVDAEGKNVGSELSLELNNLSQATTYCIGVISEYIGGNRSELVFVSGKTNEEGIRLYPNPVDKVLNVKAGKSIPSMGLIIYNSSGAKVHSATVTNLSVYESVAIDVSKLVGGTYQVVLNYNGIKETRNIIKR